MPYVTVDVDVDLTDFDTDELVQELSSRGYDYNTNGVDADAARVMLEQVYQARRSNEPYQTQLDQLIWAVLGRM
jgi:hypothetical protein